MFPERILSKMPTDTNLNIVKLLVCALLCLGIGTSYIKAQEKRFYYNHITPEDGLIYDEILYAQIDQDGFLWLATAMGLQCIEAYSSRKFYHDPGDSLSLNENFVTTLFEDSSGRIWIGTAKKGANYYDKEFDKFVPVKSRPGIQNSLTSNLIPRAKKSITQDRDGYIWINTGRGLNRFDPTNNSNQQYFGDYTGQIIYDSAAHALWIADKDFRKLDLNTGELDNYSNLESSKRFTQINKLIQDRHGNIWLGTDNGLFIFDSQNNQFLTLEAFFNKMEKSGEKIGEWSNELIEALYEDVYGSIWVAVGKAIYIINSKNGEIAELRHQADNRNTILDERVSGIFGNRDGTVLVTYIRGGLTKISIDLMDFKRLDIADNESDNISSRAVRSVLKDKNDNLWVATYFGLNFVPSDSDQPIKSYYNEPGNPKSIISNYITAIYIDSNDRLWLGSFQSGFCYADDVYNSDRLTFYRSDFDREVEVHEFTEYPEGKIWISTDEGFHTYDYDADQLSYYGDAAGEARDLQEINVQSVHVEEPNTFWLATWNKGFARLVLASDLEDSNSRGNDEITYFTSSNTDEVEDSESGFVTLLKGEENIFWLASNVDGLVKAMVEGDRAQFVNYDISAGAPSNSIYGIQSDNSGYVWVSSSYGIGKFDPAEERFYNYYESDGLQGNHFSWDAQYKSEEGQIYFGGNNGLTAFFPEDINQDINNTELNAKVYLSNLVIDHEEVQEGVEVNGNVILEKSIRYTREITLTHLESIFTVEFGVHNNDNPEKIVYSYKLDGYDEKWIRTNSENRRATYTNLNPGEYQFMVKGSNQLGMWDESVTLKIVILPPWWRTWWAYLFYLGLFLILIFFLQQQLLKRAELTHKLEFEQMMHEKDLELSRQKFNFFTNLSHEFRTPLTLILGPLERLINRNEVSNRVHQKHQLIYSQARKMLKLTNQLLNFRKYETENLTLQAAEGNIVKFLDEVVIAFRNQARLKNIHFSFKTDSKDIKIWYDRDKIEIILSNIFSNAFKYTPAKGAIDFTVGIVSKNQVVQSIESEMPNNSVVYGKLPAGSDECLQLIIEDSGCGIAKDQLKHIFKHYYQTSNSEFSDGEGSGIGLEITKNYVELHQGSIMARSREGSGTTFYVWLPAGNTHLASSEMIEDFKSSEHLDHYQIGELNKEGEINIRKDLVSGEVLADVSELLIIDDNPDIRAYLKSIFEKHFKVHVGADGKEGLDMALRLIPDLIISDVMMPEINGFELCSTIKSNVNTSHIPVILLTARTSTIFQNQGIETGADDYVTKPFNEKTLLLKVRNLISSRRQLRTKYAREITLQPRDITINNTDESFLDNVIEIIEEDMSNGNLKIEDYSKRLGMSHSAIYKKIKFLTDMAPVEFIRTIRLKKAKEYLQKSNLSVSQVSFEVGFSDPKYFSKRFHKYFGRSPSSYLSRQEKVTHRSV